MAINSSISNFEKDTSRWAGKPWACLLAVAMLIAVELVVRSLPVEVLIPHGLGEVEYEAVALTIRDIGPAQTCIVGSSRSREGLNADKFGDGAANYSCPANRIAEVEAVINLILRQRDNSTQRIIYGITPFQLLPREQEGPQAVEAIFWDWEDWRRESEQFPDFAGPTRARLVRQAISRSMQTLRYRSKPGSILIDTFELAKRGRLHETTVEQLLSGSAIAQPTLGTVSRWHVLEPERSLVTEPIPDRRVQQFLSKQLINGEFIIGDDEVERLHRIVKLCRENGIELVLVELPLPEIMKKYIPESVFSEFRETIVKLAESEAISLVSLDALMLDLQNEHFLDSSHLNRAGSTRLSVAVAEYLNRPKPALRRQ